MVVINMMTDVEDRFSFIFCFLFIRYAMYEEWELTSMDDGIHAKEK